MNKTNTGGPAFPQPLIETNGGILTADDTGEGGMTLRDYAAIKFAAELVRETATQPFIDQENAIAVTDKVARMAYFLADAMIRAREAA